MVIIIIINMMQIILLTRMITKQLEKEGARPTLLDPLEVGAPLLAQPLHFMVSFTLVFCSYRDYFMIINLSNMSTSLQKDQSQAPQWMLDTHKVIQESQG